MIELKDVIREVINQWKLYTSGDFILQLLSSGYIAVTLNVTW